MMRLPKSYLLLDRVSFLALFVSFVLLSVWIIMVFRDAPQTQKADAIGFIGALFLAVTLYTSLRAGAIHDAYDALRYEYAKEHYTGILNELTAALTAISAKNACVPSKEATDVWNGVAATLDRVLEILRKESDPYEDVVSGLRESIPKPGEYAQICRFRIALQKLILLLDPWRSITETV